MNRHLFFLFIALFSGHVASQEQQANVACDVLLCDKMFAPGANKSISFLNNVCVTPSRHILLASKDSLYLLGFGGYVSYSPKEKNISAFCVSNNNIYYSNQKRITVISANGTENLILTLPFAPAKLWGGVNAIYATYSLKGKNFLYVILPKEKIYNKILELSNNAIHGVIEYENIIYVVTSTNLYVIDVGHGEFAGIPLALNVLGQIYSATIDTGNGMLYLSGSNGIFRYSHEELQKISTEQGCLCFDKEGLIVFNKTQAFLYRVRNTYLNPKPEEVRIELK